MNAFRFRINMMIVLMSLLSINMTLITVNKKNSYLKGRMSKRKLKDRELGMKPKQYAAFRMLEKIYSDPLPYEYSRKNPYYTVEVNQINRYHNCGLKYKRTRSKTRKYLQKMEEGSI